MSIIEEDLDGYRAGDIAKDEPQCAESTLQPPPMLLSAAFTIETLAHLQGHERQLLPQAQFLRDLQAQLSRVRDAVGDEYRDEEIRTLLNMLEEDE